MAKKKKKTSIFINIQRKIMNKKLLKSILCIASGMGFVASIPFAVTSCGCSSEDVIPSKALPYEVYNTDENNVLLGFTNEFLADPTAYDMYNTMEIPARVTSVGYEAFYNNSASTIPSFITNLTFAENSNCSTVGIRAFINCSSLTSVSFSKNLMTINNSAFHSCFNLTSVDLLNCSSLTYIGGATFKNCSSLVSADFSNTKLETLDYENFKNCSRLISIKFPSTVTRVYNDVFQNCSKFRSITWDAWTGRFNTLQSSSFSNVCRTGKVKVTNPTDGHDSAALRDYLTRNGGLPSSWEVAKD